MSLNIFVLKKKSPIFIPLSHWLTNIYSKPPKRSLGIKDANKGNEAKESFCLGPKPTTNPGHGVSLPYGWERRSTEFPYESTLFFMDAVQRKNTLHAVWTRSRTGRKLSGLYAWILLLTIYKTWCILEQETKSVTQVSHSKMEITVVFIS